jgi:hypothetical protein
VWAVLSADALDCFAHVLKPWWWRPEPVGGRRTRRAVHTRCGRGAPVHGNRPWAQAVVNMRTRLRAVHALGGWAGVLSTACEPPTTSAPCFVRRHTQLVLRQHRALVCPRGLPDFLPVPLWSFARAPRPLDPKPLRFPAFPRQLLPGRPRWAVPAGLRPFELPTDLSFCCRCQSIKAMPCGGPSARLDPLTTTPSGCMGSAVLRAWASATMRCLGRDLGSISSGTDLGLLSPPSACWPASGEETAHFALVGAPASWHSPPPARSPPCAFHLPAGETASSRGGHRH